MMEQKNTHRKKPILLWLALLIVIVLIAKFAYGSWSKYQLWVNHKTYFEQPRQEQLIQTWMSPHFISRRYGIDFESVINTSPSYFEAKNPLENFCKSHKLNCKELTTKLDSVSNPSEDSPFFD